MHTSNRAAFVFGPLLICCLLLFGRNAAAIPINCPYNGTLDCPVVETVNN